MSDYTSKPLTSGLTRSETGLRLVLASHERRERFLALVQKGLPDACWPWLGSTNRKGYGVYRTTEGYQRFAVAAHRLALALETGSAPDGHALHKCDNPPCCNPAHLYAGTDADNVRDMLERGRHVPGPGFDPEKTRVGHAHYMANIEAARASALVRLPQAVTAYRTGASITAAAKLIGCSVPVLRAAFKRERVPIRRPGNPDLTGERRI